MAALGWVTWRVAVAVLLVIGCVVVIAARGDVWSLKTLATLLATFGLVGLVASKEWGFTDGVAFASIMVSGMLFFTNVGSKIDDTQSATFAFNTISDFEVTPNALATGEIAESSEYMNRALQTCSPDRVATLGALELAQQASQIAYLSGRASDMAQAASDVSEAASPKKPSECAQVLGYLASRHQFVRAALNNEAVRLKMLAAKRPAN